MITVKIIKNWNYPDLFRQTENHQGIWQKIQYTTEELTEYDYVIVCNTPPKNTVVSCQSDNIWCILQEPPNEYFYPMHNANRVYHTVFTQDKSLIGKRFIHCPGALPWHIDKSYDQLKNMRIPAKTRTLSWVTTNKTNFLGHKRRMSFLGKITGKLDIDLYGKGIREIADKWDGLAPYQYSLAVENFSGPDYWSEKLSDCFLSWTMPFYYGCTNLDKYFPKESYISVDIKNPDVISQIKKCIKQRVWEKNLDAITKARNLVLEKYQFFPFFSNQIQLHHKNHMKQNNQQIMIPEYQGPPLLKRIINRLNCMNPNYYG